MHHYISNTTQEERNCIYFFTMHHHKIHSKNYYLSITIDKSNLTYQNISNYNAALWKGFLKKPHTFHINTAVTAWGRNKKRCFVYNKFTVVHNLKISYRYFSSSWYFSNYDFHSPPSNSTNLYCNSVFMLFHKRSLPFPIRLLDPMYLPGFHQV